MMKMVWHVFGIFFFPGEINFAEDEVIIIILFLISSIELILIMVISYILYILRIIHLFRLCCVFYDVIFTSVSKATP